MFDTRSNTFRVKVWTYRPGFLDWLRARKMKRLISSAKQLDL